MAIQLLLAASLPYLCKPWKFDESNQWYPCYRDKITVIKDPDLKHFSCGVNEVQFADHNSTTAENNWHRHSLKGYVFCNEYGLISDFALCNKKPRTNYCYNPIRWYFQSCTVFGDMVGVGYMKGNQFCCVPLVLPAGSVSASAYTGQPLTTARHYTLTNNSYLKPECRRCVW